MKPRDLRFLPSTLMVCVAPILVSGSLQAKVVHNYQSNGSNAWTLPAGTNLLTGTTPSPATVVAHEGSDSSWSSMIDGSLGDAGGAPATSCTPNGGDTVTFPLDISGKPGGYNITSFDAYCSWANSGRDNQDFTLQYSTVAAPDVFITIAAVMNHTGVDRSTHTRLTDDSGFLAMGVHSVRLIFDTDQENGFTGFREFVLQDATTVACVSHEANDANNFFIPGGTNLLSGRTPLEAAPAIQEGTPGPGTSDSWATVTDGNLGAHDDKGAAVAPLNGQTLTYPLDLTGFPSGRSITSFDSFCAWGSNGRDDQNYTLSYSTVAAPTVFIPITEVAAHTEFNGPNNRHSTHARVTGNGGPMATGVHSLRLSFSGQENGYTGFREFVLKDAPINQTTYSSNQTGEWTLPTGTNLLSSASSISPVSLGGYNHGNGDITSTSWTTLTDGTLGAVAIQGDSAAPTNGASVVFSFDTTVNTLGYNISSFDAYATWGNSGRDNQDFTVLYSTVDAPEVFIPIETVRNQTGSPVSSTHTRINPASGVLASNVGAMKFYFDNQENGYIGYREFIALGSPVPRFTPLTWSGLSNAIWSDEGVADNNWTQGNGPAPFNSESPLTFDNSGINTNINVATALTTDSMLFINDTTKSYTFSDQPLDISNFLTLAGGGDVTFNNSITAPGFNISGAGRLTLSMDNDLSGLSTMSNGSLSVTSDSALGSTALSISAGTVDFTSGSPAAKNFGGTGGSVVLGGGADTTIFLENSVATSYAGTISDGAGAGIGSLYKIGTAALTLTGVVNYSGTTTVESGELILGKRHSLYNGDITKWTASNILVSSVLTLRMGGGDEFVGADIADLKTGGFGEGAALGFDTTSGNATISEVIASTVALRKSGLNVLTLTAENSFSGGITVVQGALEAGNAEGASIPGDLMLGNATFDAYANMLHSDQFGPDSIVRFGNGQNLNGKFQLRGTTQTIAGLESDSTLALVQNDEANSPGYTSNPGAATLVIDTDNDHSFRGIIRNQDGGPLSLIKRGTGTQELQNVPVQGYGYSGATLIEEGTLLINFARAGSGFASNVDIADIATLKFNSSVDGYDFNPIISGGGKLLVTGSNPVALTNGANSWIGGTTVDGGFLALKAVNANGDGNGEGQTCVGGAMTPSNVINLINGGTLSLDNAGALGNSPVLPQFAPSIQVNEGCKIYGGTNTIGFVSNITLDGGKIEATNGAEVAGFNTNLCLVGTVIVGGSSAVPSEIHTTGTGPNANISLGSMGLTGTTFQVADIAEGPDLVVSSILTNVNVLTSALTKTGPGTMLITGANTYTGTTTIQGGELHVNGGALADTSRLVIEGGKLGIADSANETVDTLFFEGIQQIAGTYGSESSSATFKDDSRFSGSGILTVTSGPGSDPYSLWDDVIPNAADRDRADDPDNDGFTNLQEYLFGTSPISNTGSLSTMEKSGSNLIIRWSQRTPGTYLVQESATLMTGSWTTSLVTPANAVDQSGLYSADYVRKEAIIPIDAAKKFIRVKATE